MDGICTLANDAVYDQFVALLNSIEAVQGRDIPVCVYPYNDRVDKIAAEIERRSNVQLYDNLESMQRWDEFFKAVWDAHPTAHQRRLEKGFVPYYRFGHQRYFCAFDGPFDRFLYLDADTLLMNRVEPIFEKLDRHDIVVYDYQYKDPGHVYDLSSPKLTELFSVEQIRSSIFCSGLFASKKRLYSLEQMDWLLSRLRDGEAEVLYIWASDQPILNYMAMRSNSKVYNFALNLPEDKLTGCCVTSSHFEERDSLLFDRGNQLTYIHYIGISSKIFNRLCQGENIDFPYRDLFLYYRYLHEPENRPRLKGKAKAYNAPPSLTDRVLKKLKLVR
ncbi:MAG TPA: sugar transferase [Oscillatoriales cyanobacterium M59_W2019_021]|nr:MAG: sugar transferase [Cyanobacteria bacterium J055]HIK32233.1 sugar transferase [Oscillatoriales cyanobacterium M4454_W2019_049]HIK52292.1 sugar transferase [Oscillatoriales cyanobacterium M59_W2019_021]